MRSFSRAVSAAVISGSIASVSASASLAHVCTVANVESALKANTTLLGLQLISGTVTAASVNVSTSTGMGGTTTSIPAYCNVTLEYTHAGKNDSVIVKYAMPAPSTFKNRFYVEGGGGYSISSSATGGLDYGAAGGASDAGYGALSSVAYDSVNLYANYSINWDNARMFGYQALGEMTLIGKALSPGFYNLSSSTKIYTYYEGCSDGGREGMSQVQKWGEHYDGVITGAPAFRMAQQQVGHIVPATIEHTMDYYPPPCELAKIVNATIAACDPLDGRTDGVISRTDLCKLKFNLTSIIGESYYCAASTSSSEGFGYSGSSGGAGSSTSTTPAQNGTVSAKGVAVAQAVYDGLHNSKGQQAYLAWQIGSSLSDAETTYNSTSGKYGLDIPSTGGEWVTRFVELVEVSNLSNLDNVTYDTLVDWMNIGMARYYDTLQTTWPDLTPFMKSGGKLLHYHGESDPSIPAASSVHYWQAVRSIMYPHTPSNASLEEMEDWYQFYLIPGAGHCGTNSLQPGPYPEDNMETMIEWVEGGIRPSRLNATVSSGYYEGEVQKLCMWPTRPLWVSNSTFNCVNDTASIKSWTYEFTAFKFPVY